MGVQRKGVSRQMDAIVEGKFVEAKSNGQYIRGQIIAGGVQRFYADSEADPGVVDKLLKLRELDQVRFRVTVYANTPKGGGTPYLSVKVVGVEKVAASSAA